ncbi:hypothetical protein CQA53_06795 [Helicobacter didelphidarum]|uniref:Fido domain-containing protein n=2 Tax=Helicobacter didelphidarum TaxID=2040648 RepID=A0A3D8IJV2_9HELI|nr:hypothetical protein CQA53_06795 [Helicobacter didelphidarum]
MAQLFGVQRQAITKHINNIFKEDELSKEQTCSILEQVQQEGNRQVVRNITFYNLDMIIAVGYRVNSKKATKFRIWATQILKNHIIKGYTINRQRLLEQDRAEFLQTIAILQESIAKSEASGMLTLTETKGFLDIIIRYSRTWNLLQRYDRDDLEVSHTQGREAKFILDSSEAKEAIANLKSELIRKGEASELFGREKAGEFEGILRNIYQTFGGVDLLPSIEAKAANLLYYIIKGHPFSDGNKRIGAFMFILFLSKNNALYKPNGELKINDNALVALSLMSAQSEPTQKESIINLIINLLGESQ